MPNNVNRSKRLRRVRHAAASTSASASRPFLEFSVPVLQIGPPPQFAVTPAQPQPVVEPSDQLIAACVRALFQLVSQYPKETALIGGLVCLGVLLGSDNSNRRR
jgi:hypothetical protein